MGSNDFQSGVQDGLTIWHEEQTSSSSSAAKIVAALFKGRIAYSNGAAGTYAGVETINVANDKEPFTGNMIALLGDGSISYETFEGEVAVRTGPNRVGGTGTWRMTSGTGQFANLTRGGPFTWNIDGDTYHADFTS